MTTAFRSCLYQGAVMHHRVQPLRHKFTYRLTTWLIDIDELPTLDQMLTGFSWNRPGLFSFYNRDYGLGNNQSPREFINDLMAQHQLPEPTRVSLLCQVRSFGYVFNPLSVWFCFDQQDRLQATLYEVRNTFGERHHYLIKEIAENHSQAGLFRHHANKCFYVSPFIPMQSDYHFRFQLPGQNLNFAIHQTTSEGVLLNAVWKGKQQPLTQASLLQQVIRFPLNTVKIISAIHWQALKLWLKGLRLVRREAAPRIATSEGSVRH